MSPLKLVLIIVLFLLALSLFPAVGFAPAGWGYGPSGLLGIVFLVVLILALTGRL